MILVHNIRFTQYSIGSFIFETYNEGIVDASMYQKMMQQ